MLTDMGDGTGAVTGDEESRLVISLREARSIRKSKNKLFRSICDSLHKQLSQDLSEHKDKIIDVVMMGGALRVGIETAIPDDKLVNLDERRDDLPFDPPVESSYGTDVPPKIEMATPAPQIEVVSR